LTEKEVTTSKPLRIDPAFKNRVVNMPGGETLKICFQCGTCTSSCPVAQFVDSYRPNQIMRLAQLGLKERILPSKTLWLCTACSTCVDRCPQGVEMASVLRVLQNLAVEEFYIPRLFKDLGAAILRTGFVYNIPNIRIKKREEAGLPPLPQTNIDEIKKLAEKTGFTKIVEGGE
jgi:heterodisulfide reductase subunit C